MNNITAHVRIGIKRDDPAKLDGPAYVHQYQTKDWVAEQKADLSNPGAVNSSLSFRELAFSDDGRTLWAEGICEMVPMVDGDTVSDLADELRGYFDVAEVMS